jgi:hypothetical protein
MGVKDFKKKMNIHSCSGGKNISPSRRARTSVGSMGLISPFLMPS